MTLRPSTAQSVALTIVVFCTTVLAVWLVLASGLLLAEKRIDTSKVRQDATAGTSLAVPTSRFYRFAEFQFAPQPDASAPAGTPRHHSGGKPSIHSLLEKFFWSKHNVIKLRGSDNSIEIRDGAFFTAILWPSNLVFFCLSALLMFSITVYYKLRFENPQARRPERIYILATGIASGLVFSIIPAVGAFSAIRLNASMAPPLLVVLGFSLILARICFGGPPPGCSPRRAALAMILQALSLSCVLTLGLASSGMLVGHHRVEPAAVYKVSDKIHHYSVMNYLPGTSFSSAEPRVLSRRTTLSDIQAPFIPEHMDTRFEAEAGGRANFWRSLIRFTFRHPGGPQAVENALSVHGTLRLSAEAATVLLLLALVAAVGQRGLVMRAHAGSGATVSAALPRAAVGLGLGLCLMAAGLALGSGVLPPGARPMVVGLALPQGPAALLPLALAGLIAALLSWRPRMGRALRTGGIVLLIGFALVAPLLNLADVWTSGGSIERLARSPIHAFGMLPVSDANDYLSGALNLLATGELNGWNSRRPLTATLLALFAQISGQDLSVVMVARAVLVSVGLALVALEASLIIGGLGALALVLACALFVAEWIPVTMSEVTGCAMGLYGLAALLAAWRTNNLVAFAFGVLLTTIGLTARAGPMLVAPFIVAAGALLQRPAGLRSMMIWLAAGLAAMLLGVLHANYLIWLLGGVSAGFQSNFSQTLYGLAVGGKGWAQIMSDHPELFASDFQGQRESLIYHYAFLEIRRSPWRLIGALWQEFLRTPAFFYRFFEISVVNVWLMAGVVAAIGAWIATRDRWALLCLSIVLGLILSSPILMADGGERAYAGAIPAMALLVACGFNWTRRLLFQVYAPAEPQPKGIAHPDLPALSPAGAPTAYTVPALAGAVLALSLIVAAPLVLRAARPPELVTSRLGQTCGAGEVRSVLRGGFDLFSVVPDPAARRLTIPEVTRADLLLAVGALDPQLGRVLEPRREPYVMTLAAHAPRTERIAMTSLIVRPGGMRFDKTWPFAVACLVRIGEVDSRIIGQMAVYEARFLGPYDPRTSLPR